MNIKLEYIWLDGSNPQQLRSKTKIVRRCAIVNRSRAIIRPYNISRIKSK